MKRIYLIILLVFALAVNNASAVSYSINIDKSTIASMSEAFLLEASTESLHNRNIKKIFDSYTAAELASAGIFSSKYLDRKALTSLNLWDDRQENYYYNRIYKIVTRRIIPKMIDCAQLMIQDPSTAFYWGSYMLKATDNVQSLCKQFESVVTNSTLSFGDIAFLEISDNLKDVFNLAKLGGQDWKEIFEHLADDIEDAFTKENLLADLDNLLNKGAGLANAGFNNGLDDLLEGTDFDGTFADKVSSIITMVDNVSDMYDQYKDLSAGEILNAVVGEQNIEGIFTLGDYNLTGWIDDYSSAAIGNYYTQRVYIYRGSSGNESVCFYEPPGDNNSIMNSPEWYRINTTDYNYGLSSSEAEAVLQNSEGHAGWSRAKVEELNRNGNGTETYSFDCSFLVTNLLNSSNNLYAKAFAYEIQVYRSWSTKVVVYEAVFDSYSMDWDTFMAQMNVRLEQYNENGDDNNFNSAEEMSSYLSSHPYETNYTYYIGYGDRNYYQATDNRKIAGATSATFTVSCNGGGNLGEGSTSYKCSECGSNPSEHTKECSMRTTLSGETIDTQELKTQLAQYQEKAAELQAELDVLNAENYNLLRSMAEATTVEEYDNLKAKYDSNKEKISSLDAQLHTVNDNIADLKAAISDAEEGESAATDDYTRIPHIMQFLKESYGIIWTDNGSWSGYTFQRNGTLDGFQGQLTFEAKVSISRKPKYFLGIKIHRAIVQIDWKLSSSWTDSSVADRMELDPENSEEENAILVNERLSQLAQEHPDCTVSVEYEKRPGVNTEDTDGTYHLLWASDRLQIARDIEVRLAQIHSDLCHIEKFLHYKYSVKKWITASLPRLNADKDRKLSIAERCRRRWMHNAGSGTYDFEIEDDNY